MLTSGFAA